MEKILIIGSLGQDGTILSSILPKEKYKIYGICKKDSDKLKIDYHKKLFDTEFYYDDFTKSDNVNEILSKIKPNIIVNFAGVSNVFNPWSDIDYLYQQNCQIPLNILEYIKKFDKDIYFFQSSSSLIYGRSKKSHVSHISNFSPLYPYGITKLFSHNLVNEYRETFDIKASCGVFFNHESQYRGKNFLSKKVAKFVSEILKGKDKKIKLGNLTSQRDISHAKDFMNGVQFIIENRLNDDYIFSSCKLTSIHNFVKMFFDLYDLKMENYIEEDSTLIRKFEPCVYGDNTKLLLEGWNSKYSLETLVKDMVDFELKNENNIF
jgi:GDPmannose 4,6-dehydratase